MLVRGVFFYTGNRRRDGKLKFKIGMRTLKTGLSVFICMLITFLFKRETYIVSTITAVFTLRENMEKTMMFGKHRIAGNIFGALTSLLVIFIFDVFGNSQLTQILTIPSVIILLITLLSGFGYNEGVVGACATLLTILFMIPEQDSYVYALNRVIDSFIGMGVALGINVLVNRREVKTYEETDTSQ